MSPTRIGIVTDSSSQITPDLVERFGVEVVPMNVTIDGVDHLEGDDLDADTFYAAFDDGASPDIATSQPSPGRFADAYASMADRGHDHIVSIHVSAAMSGTIGSAELAARSSPIPVTVIDSGSASFGISVCVWAAGVAISRGANLDDIRRRIDRLTPRIATAFMIGVPHLTDRGGRASELDLGDDDGIQVLAMIDGRLDSLERVSTIDDTVDVMSSYAVAMSSSFGVASTVAIGTADAVSRPLSERLDRALDGLDRIDGVVHYRVGPSIGAHTGPGTFGLFVFPSIR
jgi:DegV family protein with EDD domain